MDERDDFEELSRVAAGGEPTVSVEALWFEGVDRRLAEYDRRLADVEKRTGDDVGTASDADARLDELGRRLRLGAALFELPSSDPLLALLEQTLEIRQVRQPR